MRKILVVGVTGRLGSVIANQLSYNQKNEVTALTRNDLDIVNEKAVAHIVSSISPDVIINCSAYNAVDKAEDEPVIAEAVNGRGVGNLAKAADIVGGTLVHYSTNYVFPGVDSQGYAEDDELSPESVYGHSKALGEALIREYTDKFYILRTQLLYGGNGGNKVSFVDAMLSLAKEGKDIQCIGDEFGQPTLVDDVASATMSLLDNSLKFGVYHACNSNIASWYDWAELIFSLKGMKVRLSKIKAVDMPRAAKRPKYGYLLNNKLPAFPTWQESLEKHLKAVA